VIAMTRDLLILFLLVVLVVWWRRKRRRHGYHEPLAPLFSRLPPRHRTRWLRMRLHLRLHPGPGLATALELFWN
jgi:hypothetical protein